MGIEPKPQARKQVESSERFIVFLPLLHRYGPEPVEREFRLILAELGKHGALRRVPALKHRKPGNCALERGLYGRWTRRRSHGRVCRGRGRNGDPPGGRLGLERRLKRRWWWRTQARPRQTCRHRSTASGRPTPLIGELAAAGSAATNMGRIGSPGLPLPTRGVTAQTRW